MTVLFDIQVNFNATKKYFSHSKERNPLSNKMLLWRWWSLPAREENVKEKVYVVGIFITRLFIFVPFLSQSLSSKIQFYAIDIVLWWSAKSYRTGVVFVFPAKQRCKINSEQDSQMNDQSFYEKIRLPGTMLVTISFQVQELKCK